ncbi:MAG: hypothetical protein E7620_04255 [Ruminococcaceae bacterium]|nr:hypothetical protein [Oscillospiraceae bacterium]
MRTTARVVSVEGKLATVETRRVSACEGCHKQEGGCSVCTLMGSSDRAMLTRAENAIGAKVGDRVTVESATGKVLLYAVLVFLVPLVTCLIGFLISAALTVSNGYRLLGAVVGFVAWFPFLRLLSVRLQRRHPDAVITEILSDEAQLRDNESTID